MLYIPLTLSQVGLHLDSWRLKSYMAKFHINAAMIVYCLHTAGCQIARLGLLQHHPCVFKLIHAT